MTPKKIEKEKEALKKWGTPKNPRESNYATATKKTQRKENEMNPPERGIRHN